MSVTRGNTVMCKLLGKMPSLTIKTPEVGNLFLGIFIGGFIGIMETIIFCNIPPEYLIQSGMSAAFAMTLPHLFGTILGVKLFKGSRDYFKYRVSFFIGMLLGILVYIYLVSFFFSKFHALAAGNLIGFLIGCVLGGILGLLFWKKIVVSNEDSKTSTSS